MTPPTAQTNSISPLRRCAHCENSKERSEFTRHPRMADGLSSWCRACQNDASRRWRAERSQEINQRRRLAYRVDHPPRPVTTEQERRERKRQRERRRRQNPEVRLREAKRDRKAYHRAYHLARSAPKPPRDPKPLFSRVRYRECGHCKRPFVARQRSKYCSDACGRAAWSGHGRRAYSGPESIAIAYANCAWCGRLFAFRAAIPQIYCQSSHAHRANKRQWHPLGMTRRAIYERDNWRCHICGKKVPDRPYAARDDDPTCDHIVPVSAGGTDHPSNLALAHNRCNWDRKDRGSAQLRLIA